jgi:hypothetical protein
MEVISRYQVSDSNKTVFISNPKHWSINKQDFNNWVEAYMKAYKYSC